MSSWRRFFVILVLCGSSFFLLGLLYSYQLPRVERWLLLEIEKQSTTHLPVRIWPQKVSLALTPPGLIFSHVKILPQGQLKKQMAPFEIKEVEVRINWSSLLLGRPRLSLISLREAEVKAIFKKNESSPPVDLWKTLNFVMAKVTTLPVDELKIQDLALWLQLKSDDVALKLSGLKLMLENRSHSVYFDFDSPVSQVKFHGQPSPVPLNFSVRGLIESKTIRISALKLNFEKSYLIGAGRLEANEAPNSPENFKFLTRLQLHLPDIFIWENLFKTRHFPPIEGQLRADLNLEGHPQQPKIQAQVTGENLSVHHFIIGDGQADLKWQNGKLELSTLEIKNSSGRFQIEKAHWNPQSQQPILAHVKWDQVELRQLLENLKIPRVPLHLETNGDVNCEITYPSTTPLQMRCVGSTKSKNFKVYEQDPKGRGRKNLTTLVEVPEALVKGEVTISHTDVQYKANLQVGTKSYGSSSGTIHYTKGFNIAYESDQLHFSDIKNLAHLELEGQTQVKGTINGNSSWARFQMNVNGKNLWLNKFWLGNPQAQLSYKTGVLHFQNILGQAGSSRYTGELSVDLKKNLIFINGKSPYLDLADLMEIFKRKATWPFSLAGTGTADLKAWGPLQFNQLSYQLNSTFFRGALAGETYDQFFFNMRAKDGHATPQLVQITKGTSSVHMTGQIDPHGFIEAQASARKLRLEESENLARLKLDLTGQLDAQLKIKGQLPHPNYELSGVLSHLATGDQSVDNSTFKLKVTPESLEGSGQFMGDVVNVSLLYPWSSQGKSKLWIKTNQWNFAPLFSIFSSSTRQRHIQTALTCLVDLSSEKGGMAHLNGPVDIKTLQLRRGSIGLANPKDIHLNFENGKMTGKGFSLEGEGGFLKFILSEISPQKLEATINGNLNLIVATLLTPFLSDLQGHLNLNLGLSGTPLEPQFSGSAYMEQVLLKFRDFPHPFTNLRADFLFNKQDILINSLRSDLGGGKLTGEGHIKVLGRTSIPVNVSGQFNNVSLNVPEGYKTKGSGTWFYRGPYFPYTIGADFNVDNGEVTAEFTNTNLNGNKVVAPSSLLPKFLTQSADQPITFDLTLHLKNPVLVRNASAQASVRGELRVLGPPNAPRLTGSLTPVPGGYIFFRDTPFEINTGFFEYTDDPPENPKIYLAAQTQAKEIVRDEQNASREKENLYEISLLAQGRARQPKITLTSIPNLTQKEIASLLALGMTPSALDNNRTAGQLASTNSIQIGTSLLQKPLNKEFRNRLGLDLQIGQAISQTDNASVPKLTINKQFTPKWLASASRTLDKAPENNVKMEYKMNKNFSVIGSWDGKEGATQLDKEKDVNQSIFGLDLEFKVNFK